MNVEEKLRAILAAIQVDVTNRGLARDPVANLFNACPDDFAHACHSIAEHPAPVLGVITGFWIASAKLGETDGPLGAVYLARTLPMTGVGVKIVSDPFCRQALQVGLNSAGAADTPLLDLPDEDRDSDLWGMWWEVNDDEPPSHVLALERVGPSHMVHTIRAQCWERTWDESTNPVTFMANERSPNPRIDPLTEETVQRFLAEVPEEHQGSCHNMHGVDIDDFMRDASFAMQSDMNDMVTIGIGDGGNEIGMGNIPWDVIRNNIPNGGLIACSWPTDYLIVAGISNWGAYALAAGVALLRDYSPPDSWFSIDREKRILREMVEQGLLVDGAKGIPSVSVDGLDFEAYIEPLRQIAAIVRA